MPGVGFTNVANPMIIYKNNFQNMTKRLTGTLEDDNELIVNFVYSHVR
jgi:hypothetical protein